MEPERYFLEFAVDGNGDVILGGYRYRRDLIHGSNDAAGYGAIQSALQELLASGPGKVFRFKMQEQVERQAPRG